MLEFALIAIITFWQIALNSNSLLLVVSAHLNSIKFLLLELEITCYNTRSLSSMSIGTDDHFKFRTYDSTAYPCGAVT